MLKKDLQNAISNKRHILWTYEAIVEDPNKLPKKFNQKFIDKCKNIIQQTEAELKELKWKMDNRIYTE